MARVLIVDDDQSVRQSLAFFLQLNGHEADEAADGLHAAERFAAHPSDVVLINGDLAGMGGWEACERLRQRSQVPIIIMSSEGHPSVRGRALLWGANVFVSKPVKLEHLLDWIQIVAWPGNGHQSHGMPSLSASLARSPARSWGGLT